MDWLALGYIAGGTALLIAGAAGVVEGGVALARRLGVSSMLVGLTIVALGTSAPEFAVSIQGAMTGAHDVVIGNVVGSNVMNILVVLGISSLVQPVAIKYVTLRRDIPFVTVASLGVLFLTLDGRLDLGEGLVLIMTGVAFTQHIYRADRMGQALPDADEARNLLQDQNVIFQIAAIGVGIAALIMGGHLLVIGAVDLAEAAGVSQRTIGLTVVALGTSLPELATALVAAYRREVDLAVGNLVGSNVFNLLLVLGTAATIHPMEVSASLVHYDIPVMIVVSLLLLRLARKGMRIERSEGGILLGSYLVYLVVLLRNAIP